MANETEPNGDVLSATHADKAKVIAWKESRLLNSAEDGDYDLTVKDFINYTRYISPKTGWWTDNMVDWSLELLRQNHNLKGSNRTIVLDTWFAGRLYRMGVQKETDGKYVDRQDENPFKKDKDRTKPYEIEGEEVGVDAFQSLQEQYPTCFKNLTGKRYVFIPINNGYANEEWVRDPETTHQGGHWSFIVVDTVSKTAGYIDSLVEVGRGKDGKDKISNIDINGGTAGKVLCGFETFMKYPKGGFKTSTLKWIPRQGNKGENHGSPDSGACGPYVYALMKYILSNRKVLMKGLRESFTKMKKANYIKDINLNTRSTRVEVQTKLWDIRRRKEELNPELHPMNLEKRDLLLTILSPTILEAVMSPNFLTSVFGKLPPEEQRNLLRPEILKATLTRHFLRSVLIAHDNLGSSIDREDYRNDKYDYVCNSEHSDDENDDDDDDDDEDDDDDGGEDEENESDDVKDITDEDLATRITELRNLEGLSPAALQQKLMRFQTEGWLPPSSSDQNFSDWVLETRTKLEKLQVTRAAKEVAFQKWLDRPSGKALNDSLTDAKMKEIMDEGHDIYVDLSAEKAKARHLRNIYRAWKADRARLRADMRDSITANIHLATITLTEYRKELKKRGYPKGYSKSNVPNFATLEADQLKLWEDASPELWTDQDKPHEITRRALLHLKFKKSFKYESEENMSIWKKDAAVFSTEEQRPSEEPRAFMEDKRRMMAHYERKTTHKFLVATDDELRAWARKLPPNYREYIDDAAGSRVRGFLQQWHFQTFKAMSDADIDTWRHVDRELPRDAQNGITSVGRYWLCTRYESGDLESLAGQEVYWPDEEEYRPSRRDEGARPNNNKRKRVAEGGIEAPKKKQRDL
ncbi:hypothetical protein K505DRAFT_421153 [Melanomma pulvis-pyrius CBS 109.77]|uniref:Ubiquitin-like protease family profile domain-containing protein n=1 Tax=Melanomma pulvis-pyrius CBS 109.77 TaxID=1314802 RepID=A0A6A6WWQ0_9PLEO|nr:hypothetical protein K505DRAFT_421153 [Melanomma pulvis-pyrius CBS 109.77]